MNLFHFNQKLEELGIPAEELDPQIIISNRFANGKSTWVVFFSAANAFAFEAPGGFDYQWLFDVTVALSEWDVAMLEGTYISDDLVQMVKLAARHMFPCELKEIIDSAYGKNRG